MAWPLAERVKRLALPVLKYDPIDMTNLQMLVFDRDGEVAGIAAWGEDTGNGPSASDGPSSSDGPTAARQALLHGLYVHPDMQGRGIGRALQRAVFASAQQDGMQAVLLRAERVSVGYFEKCGYAALPPSSEPGNTYPYRYWKPLEPALK